ncbi:hypothetical protein HRbin02_01814 [Candidatus Calditenuaceae archaeon HR02]|nr:hypothetical protein HRbin02_01814 [Candidatus Calditenuaceae archaeon HR02]
MKRREYRSRILIIRDILNSISTNSPARISTIVRDANIPYDRLVKILESMKQNSLG